MFRKQFLRRLVLTASLTGGILAGVALPSVSAAPTAAAPAAAGIAQISRLAYPAGADIWVDAGGPASTAVAGPVPGIINRVQVLVFRPAGDAMTWAELSDLYVKQGVLNPLARVEFNAISQPKALVVDPNANEEETNVYRTRTPGELLILGFIRNLQTRHQLAYSVLLSGKLNNLQAVTEGRRIVLELAGRAKGERLGLPAPQGAVPAGPTTRLVGAMLLQLQRSIDQSQNVSIRVKEMARAVMPQATAVTLSSWKTAAPLTDEAFVEFYTQQAEAFGWGLPVARDETVRGRPALLFQRPNNDGVVMVRAQPTGPGPVGTVTRPSTTIHVLIVEGKVSTASLKSK